MLDVFMALSSDVDVESAGVPAEYRGGKIGRVPVILAGDIGIGGTGRRMRGALREWVRIAAQVEA
jgi:hypothetical protein